MKHLGIGALVSLASLLAAPAGALADGPKYACTNLPAAAPSQAQIDLALQSDVSQHPLSIAVDLTWGGNGYHRDWATAAALYQSVIQRTEHLPNETMGGARWRAASEALIVMYGQGLFGLETNFPEAFRLIDLYQSRGQNVDELYSRTLALERADIDYLEGLTLIQQGASESGLAKLRSASEAGLIRARAALVQVLTYGPGPINHQEALAWGRRGDNMEHPLIDYITGYLLLEGRTSGGQDHSLSLRYVHQSARTGYPPAMQTLANALEHGIGTEQNLNEAMCWYRRAAYYGVDGARAEIDRLRAAGVR